MICSDTSTDHSLSIYNAGWYLESHWFLGLDTAQLTHSTYKSCSETLRPLLLLMWIKWSKGDEDFESSQAQRQSQFRNEFSKERRVWQTLQNHMCYGPWRSPQFHGFLRTGGLFSSVMNLAYNLQLGDKGAGRMNGATCKGIPPRMEKAVNHL